MVNLINIMSKRLHDKTLPSKTHFTKKKKKKGKTFEFYWPTSRFQPIESNFMFYLLDGINS